MHGMEGRVSPGKALVRDDLLNPLRPQVSVTDYKPDLPPRSVL